MVEEITNILLSDGIVVIRTDTIYGIIACAASQTAVEKIYAAKRREASKQCIVLIAGPSDVPAYGELIERFSKDEKLPTSVVVPASHEPEWLLRGGDSVAYRIVKNELLKQIIKQAGPIVAPSANPEGKPTARNIYEAELYFGKAVDLYVDGGEVPKTAHPSRIVRVNTDKSVSLVRP